MAKKPALGRGLSALLPDGVAFEAKQEGDRVRNIPLAQIFPNPKQPRKVFDEAKLAELAESIRSHGIMQPILVVARGDGYCIAAGERRFRAAQLAGLDEIPCILRELDEQQLAELSLLENIQREDLSALEEAAAYRSLLDRFGYTQEILSKQLGKSRSHIANTLRLLQLAPQDRRLLEQGQITAGHARALLSVADERLRARLSLAIVKEGLSVRQAEAMAAELTQPQPKKAAPAEQQRRTLIRQEAAREISQRLGVKAEISAKGQRGKVVLEFRSEDDLQNILDALMG